MRERKAIQELKRLKRKENAILSKRARDAETLEYVRKEREFLTQALRCVTTATQDERLDFCGEIADRLSSIERTIWFIKSKR